MRCLYCSLHYYTYNSAGQRLTKVEGGTTTKFVYDGAKVVLERDGNDETQARYTYEGGSLYDDLLSQRRDGASYDYLLDGLASVKQIVDSSEAIENSYSYEAFGQATVGQSDVANPYLFVGGYGVQWESTPSLYFMQARYYSPSVGRFLSEDPYGGSPQDPMSLHRYLYCGNGPVSRTDASGALFAAVCYYMNREGSNGTRDDKLAYCKCMAADAFLNCIPGAVGGYMVGWGILPVIIVAVGVKLGQPLVCGVGIVIWIIGALPCGLDRCWDEYQQRIAECERLYGPPPKPGPTRSMGTR